MKFKNLGKLRFFYTLTQKSLYASTFIVIATMIAARFLGLVKLRILTTFYSKAELDLFLAAFRVPDFIFDILVVGSISACFIPIIRSIKQDSNDNKQITLSFTFTLMFVFLAIWGLFLMLVFPFRETIFALFLPGYTQAQVAQVAQYSMIVLMLQVPLLIIGNIAVALMQSRKQFLIPGLAPVVYNLGIIIGVVFGAQKYGVYAAVFGVVIGAFLYFILVFPVFIFSWRKNIVISLHNKYLKPFFTVFVPRVFSVIITQIDATVDLALATLKGSGDYTAFYLAQNLQVLPVSFIGIALAQTLLPFFSDLGAKKKPEEIMGMLTRIVVLIFFTIIPIVVFFTVLRVPFIRLIYGGQKFDWSATVTTAYTLSIFALSMPFHTAYYVISRAYFALHDTKTPLIIGLITTIINSGLSILFISYLNLPVWYLAVSFAVAITINTMSLFFILLFRLNNIKIGQVMLRLIFIGFIGFVMGLVVWSLRKLLDGLVFDTTRTLQLFWLTSICVFAGFGVYGYLAWLFIPDEFVQLMKLFKRLRIVRITVDKYLRFFYFYRTTHTIEDKYDDTI